MKVAKTTEYNGFLLLDKPVGLSSNAALQKVRRMFQHTKAGHTGSLDPLASGMLPICLGEATKFTQYLLDANKSYEFTAKLGQKTTTGDAEGKIILERSIGPLLTEQHILEVLKQFRGPQLQKPPMYSAIKVQGQPLYKLAREGKEIERQSRCIHVFDLTLVKITNDQITLRALVSKGTYIRTLVEEIGEALGCGAHVTYLRRLTVGDYRSDQMYVLEDLKKAQPHELQRYLYPIEKVVHHLEPITLTKEQAMALRHGKTLILPGHQSGFVRLLQEEGHFFGVGEIVLNQLVVQRLLRPRPSPS